PGPFTAMAAVGADPDLTNNTAVISLTVLPQPSPAPFPQPFPATGSGDVTALVRVVRKGRRAGKRLAFTITNTRRTQICVPLAVTVATLPRSIKLRNAGGLTADKQKFVMVDVGGANVFDPGESVTVRLLFSKLFRPRRLRVLAGTFG